MIKLLEENVKAVVAVVALLPGLVALFEVVDLPPTDKELLKIAVTSASLVSALIVLLAAGPIGRARKSRVALVLSLLFIAGIGSLLAWRYFDAKLHHEYVVDETAATITLPIVPGPLQEKYAMFDLDQALEHPIVGRPLVNEIEARNDFTAVFLAILLVMAQLALTGGILLGFVRLVGDSRRTG